MGGEEKFFDISELYKGATFLITPPQGNQSATQFSHRSLEDFVAAPTDPLPSVFDHRQQAGKAADKYKHSTSLYLKLKTIKCFVFKEDGRERGRGGGLLFATMLLGPRIKGIVS